MAGRVIGELPEVKMRKVYRASHQFPLLSHLGVDNWVENEKQVSIYMHGPRGCYVLGLYPLKVGEPAVAAGSVASMVASSAQQESHNRKPFIKETAEKSLWKKSEMYRQ